MFKYQCDSNDQGRNLYKITIKLFPYLPISKIEKMFRLKEIKVNNKRTNNKKWLLNNQDEIIYYCSYKTNLNFEKNEDISEIKKPKLKIIYEDQNILLVEKDHKTNVHSEVNCLDEQVLNYLNFHNNSPFKPSHIGRLDRNTSGIMIYAKNYSTLRYLLENKNTIQKTYLLKNNMKTPINQIVKNKIEIDENNKKVNVYNEKSSKGKLAITHFFNIDKNIYAEIETGRKHQIRATSAWLGYPIIGDQKYNKNFSKNDMRLFLHCYKVQFRNLENELSYLNNKEFILEPKKWKE